MNTMTLSDRVLVRAKALCQEARIGYEMRVRDAPKNHSALMICNVGNLKFEVHSVTAFSDDIIAVTGKEADGNIFTVYAPVEGVSFMIMLVKKEGPSRKIGFHSEMAERKKQMI